MKRPLLLVGLLYAGGILLADLFHPPPVPLLASALLLAVISIVWAPARPSLLWPLILLTGSANLGLRTAVISPNDLRALLGERTEIVTARGTLRQTPQLRVYAHEEAESWRTMAQFDVTAIRVHRENWRPA